MNNDKNSISVLIRDRQRIVLEEKVKAITSLNEKGVFDVLPQHENFISLINETLVIHRHNGTKEEIKIEGGVLRVYENQVQIYLGFKSFNKKIDNIR